jgi:tRNA(Ile)-lysidine synthase TilS/MesJ
MKRCRTTELRTIYEDVTRRIRFSFYTWFQCPVILGHNQDDCYENAFRNLARQVHFENLFGMSAIGAEQGVTTLRPMLGVAKRDIRAFADATGIPHLVDSTPAWSQRGQMRDRLIPAIADFDPHILTGLSAFVERSQFLEAQWSSAFQTWITPLVVQEKRLRLPRDAFLESNCQSLNFWIQLWQKMALQARPSNKSFRNFMEALGRNREHRCDMNARCMAHVDKDCIEFVWK